MITVFTLGVLRQYSVKASNTTWVPACWPDRLVVRLGYHPARAAGGAPVQHQKIKERRFEVELDRTVVDKVDSTGLVVQDLGVGAAVLLECELHVFGRNGITVVELDALAQFESR
jgi:hypothetical protein